MSYTKTFNDIRYSQKSYAVNGSLATNSLQNWPLAGTRTGTSVKDWREKISMGLNASSDYFSDRQEFTLFEPGSATASGTRVGTPSTIRTDVATGFWQQTPIPTLAHLSPSANEATAEALRRTYNKVRSELENLNSAAVVAEGLSVIRQFGAPAAAIVELTNRRINRLYLEGRGLKGSVAFRRLKFAEIVASTYLEYAFGLAPLISDTVAVAESLARWQEEADGYNGRLRSRIVGRGTSEMSASSTGNGTVGAFGWLRSQYVTKTVSQYKVQYVCGLDSSHLAAAGSNERLMQILGFNPGNWIPAIWEWLPWSWLFDYFANINDILNAGITSTAGVKWTCKTVSQETVKEVRQPVSTKLTADAYAFNGYKLGSASGHLGNYAQRRSTITRVANANLGVPPLVFTVPTANKQLANMVAVLLSRRKESSAALWLF